MGDILVVGLNGDDSIRKLKGIDRPINNLQARAEVLAGLEAVDFIIPFNDETPIKLIEEIVPDILVKGGDYEVEKIVGYGIAKKTVVLPFKKGFSTSLIVKKVKFT